MDIKREIENRLQVEFNPQKLRIIDESEKHIGHQGYRDGGQTHFMVEIISKDFKKLSRIESHRRIHEALGDLLQNDIHALRLKVKSE